MMRASCTGVSPFHDVMDGVGTEARRASGLPLPPLPGVPRLVGVRGRLVVVQRVAMYVEDRRVVEPQGREVVVHLLLHLREDRLAARQVGRAFLLVDEVVVARAGVVAVVAPGRRELRALEIRRDGDAGVVDQAVLPLADVEGSL